MIEIEIKGKAEPHYGGNLEDLDGIDCQDCFSEYFSDVSAEDVISGGYMRFKYEDGDLFTITTYKSERKLTDMELNELVDYTQGQWSDGIGEGFEQFPQYVNDEEVYISPWYVDQKIETTQKNIEDE